METKLFTRMVGLVIVLSLLCVTSVYAFAEQDLTMEGSYIFTGQFVDSADGSIINIVQVSDNLGYSTTTSSGVFSNSYNYGSVTFTFTSTLYTTVTYTVTMNSDITTNISMTRSVGGGTQTVYSTAHKVRFLCRDYRGEPIPDMHVSAVGVESTLGAIGWVLNLFGINLDTTPITSTLMEGTTGNDGAITFVMLETEKYRLNFSKPSVGINEFRYYYPSETEYNEIFWTEIPVQSHTVINWQFYNYSVNATTERLGVQYTDQLGSTDNLTFVVQDNASNPMYVRVYNTGGYIINASSDVIRTPGETYYWGFQSNSTEFANKFNVTHFITFEGSKWMIDPMGAGKAGADPLLVQTAAITYSWAATGLIMVFALIFPRFSIKIGVVIIPLMGALFKYIGWLTITWTLVAVALGFGILLSFRYSEEDG